MCVVMVSALWCIMLGREMHSDSLYMRCSVCYVIGHSHHAADASALTIYSVLLYA